MDFLLRVIVDSWFVIIGVFWYRPDGSRYHSKMDGPIDPVCHYDSLGTHSVWAHDCCVLSCGFPHPTFRKIPLVDIPLGPLVNFIVWYDCHLLVDWRSNLGMSLRGSKGKCHRWNSRTSGKAYVWIVPSGLKDGGKRLHLGFTFAKCSDFWSCTDQDVADFYSGSCYWHWHTCLIQCKCVPVFSLYLSLQFEEKW